MASQIFTCLNFTNDHPGANKGGRMPCLDLEVWMDTEQREEGVPKQLLEQNPLCKTGKLKRIILYSFYRKPMSNDTPLSRRNAAPEKVLITTAGNEYLRRLKNVSRDLPTPEVEKITAEYSTDLMRGCFSKEWVKATLKAAATGYMRKVTAQNKGGGPYQPSREP